MNKVMRALLVSIAVVFWITTLALAGAASADETVPIKKSDVRSLTTSGAWTQAAETKNIDKVKNLTDRVNFSSWVGDASRGEVWLKYQFIGTRYVSRVEVLAGCTGSNRTFAEFGRPDQLELSNEKRAVVVTVRDSRKSQVIVVDPPLPATNLTIKVKSHHGGKKSGVCFTELHLHEQNALGQLDDTRRQILERHAAALGTDGAGPAVLGLINMGPAAVPRLSLALGSDDPNVQRDALRALERIGSPSSADSLLRFWAARPPFDLRGVTLSALARTGDVRAMPIVAEAMEDDDFELADMAASKVAYFGPGMIPHLRRLLRSEHEDVVERAIRALAHVGGASAVELAKPFCRARKSSQRVAAAEAIGSNPCDEGLTELEFLLRDEHPNVRVAVAKALGRFKTPRASGLLSRMLRDPDMFVGQTALAGLAKSPGGARYMASYLQEAQAPIGQDVIVELARTGGESSIHVMVDALRRGEARFRVALRDALVTLGKPGAARLLEAALEDDRLVEDAEVVLAKMPKHAVPLLADVVARDPSAPPLFVIRTLGRTKGAASLEVLDKVWASGGATMRLLITEAWSNYPSAAVRGRVIAAMRTEDITMRHAAAKTAAAIGIRDAAPIFMEALSSGRIPIETAIDGLARLQDPSAERYMVDHFSTARTGVRLAILRACKTLETPACLRILYGATNDRDPHIRFEAMKLLADNK